LNDEFVFLKRDFGGELIEIKIFTKSEAPQVFTYDDINIDDEKEEEQSDYFEVFIRNKKKPERSLCFNIWSYSDTLDIQSISLFENNKELFKVLSEDIDEVLYDKIINLLAERNIKESFIKVITLSLRHFDLNYEKNWMQEVKNFLED